MLLSWVALWSIGIVLLIADRKNEIIRWAAYIAFAAGSGALAEAIEINFRPSLDAWHMLTPALNISLVWIYNLCYIITHIIGPYFFIIFASMYGRFFTSRTVIWLKRLLIQPVLVIILFTPYTPRIQLSFNLLAVCAVPYILSGLTMLVLAYKNAHDRIDRQEKFFTMIAVGIPVCFVLFSNFIARSFGINNAFQYNSIIVGFQFLFIIGIIIKHNFMGIRVRFETQRRDMSIRSALSGMGILAHTMKNKLLITKASMDLLQKSDMNLDDKESMQCAMDAVTHLLMMTRRINDNIHELRVEKSVVNLSQVFAHIEKIHLLLLVPRNISLVIQPVQDDMVIEMDEMHVTESINNIIRNAMEAIQENGSITISVTESKYAISISITDDGPGIRQENLANVLDPFFTTKQRDLNFGLGLSYCYNVMRLHDGELNISSTYGKGTTVTMVFKLKSVFSRIFR